MLPFWIYSGLGHRLVLMARDADDAARLASERWAEMAVRTLVVEVRLCHQAEYREHLASVVGMRLVPLAPALKRSGT